MPVGVYVSKGPQRAEPGGHGLSPNAPGIGEAAIVLVMTDRGDMEEVRETSPLGMSGGIYRGDEAIRYADAIKEWRESGYDDRVMIDAGFWEDD